MIICEKKLGGGSKIKKLSMAGRLLPMCLNRKQSSVEHVVEIQAVHILIRADHFHHSLYIKSGDKTKIVMIKPFQQTISTNTF